MDVDVGVKVGVPTEDVGLGGSGVNVAVGGIGVSVAVDGIGVTVAVSVAVMAAVGLKVGETGGLVGVGDGVRVGTKLVEVGDGVKVNVGVTVAAYGVVDGLAVKVGVWLASAGVIVGTFGTYRRCPARIAVLFPRQFACCKVVTLTPKARPMRNRFSPGCTV